MHGLTRVRLVVETGVGERVTTIELVNDDLWFGTKEEYESYRSRLNSWLTARPQVEPVRLPPVRNPRDPMDQLARILNFDEDDHLYEKSPVFDQEPSRS